MVRSKKVIWICLLLGLGTGLLYWPAVHHDFINYDDREYISDNHAIQSGLTLQTIKWAFRSGYASNWHPLTWISLALDCQLYGLNPAGHHLTSLVIHCVNSVLLFILLNQMTGAPGRSGFVAALFAWHPLHVESVAWASERKDLLCGLFWILTMLAYVQYVKVKVAGNPTTKLWYGAAIFLFALALMSKPMAVTLPFVLLIVDFWPLRRITLNGSSAGNDEPARSWLMIRKPLLEKMPFFALTLASCIVTVLVQRGAAASLQHAPMLLRLENAAVAYISYIAKTLWPARLAVVYPFPNKLSAGWALAAALIVLIVSSLFLTMLKRRPYYAAGWFWFLGTLLPVIGLLQVGSQAIADRYTYLPGIGLAIVIAWGTVDLLARLPHSAKICEALGALSVAACFIVTRHQLSYWQNSVTLFRHAIEVTTDNYIAYGALGMGLQSQGQTGEALQMYEESARVEARYAEVQYNLGSLLLNLGRTGEAIQHLELALKEKPRFANAENNLGKALLKEGKTAEAESHLHTALNLAPGDPEAHYNLGTVLLVESKFPAAADEFSRALELNPEYAEAHGNYAIALAQLGRPHEALNQFFDEVRLDPANPSARLNLGRALMGQHRPAEAKAQFSEALRLQPDNATAHYLLATALAAEGNARDAVFQCREALRFQPGFKEAQDELNRLDSAAH